MRLQFFMNLFIIWTSVAFFGYGCGQHTTDVNYNLPNIHNEITKQYEDTFVYEKPIMDNENVIYVSQEDKDLALKLHNDIRAEVGITHKLEWDSELEQDAITYVKTLVNNGEFEHDPNNKILVTGENIYTSTGYTKNYLTKTILSYYSEKPYYTYGKIGDNSTCKSGYACGHYTQLIWKNTSYVGCAVGKYKRGQYKDWYVSVCKYRTPGNYIGETPY